MALRIVSLPTNPACGTPATPTGIPATPAGTPATSTSAVVPAVRTR